MAVGQSEDSPVVALDHLATSAPVHAAFLRVAQFPLDRGGSAKLAKLLGPWLQGCADRLSLQTAIGLQGSAVHNGETAGLLTDHGREWMPDLGLGIRPTGEPPRMLNQDDLNKLKWDQMPKPKHETVFLLINGASAAPSALPLLCGTGALLYILLDAPAEVYLNEQRDLWLPTIQDPAFRAHPFYLPLFDSRCLQDNTASRLRKWMGRAVVYVRESAEELGILVLTSRHEAIEWLERDLHVAHQAKG